MIKNGTGNGIRRALETPEKQKQVTKHTSTEKWRNESVFSFSLYMATDYRVPFFMKLNIKRNNK